MHKANSMAERQEDNDGGVIEECLKHPYKKKIVSLYIFCTTPILARTLQMTRCYVSKGGCAHAHLAHPVLLKKFLAKMAACII